VQTWPTTILIESSTFAPSLVPFLAGFLTILRPKTRCVPTHMNGKVHASYWAPPRLKRFEGSPIRTQL